MKTILEVLKLSADYLEERKVENPRREAEDLITDALQLKRVDLYLSYDRPCEEKELSLIRERLKRRGLGEPLAYIQGEVEFYGCRIKVNRSVLIPRQETEILVDLAAQEIEKREEEGLSVLDLCSGSGCIGIALKKRFPSIAVTLADISEEALKVAFENRKLNQVEADIKKGDFFAPLRGQRFDFILCNPPYVSAKEYETLSPAVKAFEPSCALLGGEDGLAFYRRLAEEAYAHLKPGGELWMEIGSSQGPSILSLFSNNPWKNPALFKDWAGHDRFILIKY